MVAQVDNSLAVQELSVYNAVASDNESVVGVPQVNRKSFFWIASLAFACLIGIGATPIAAGQQAPGARQPAVAGKAALEQTTAKKSTRYSARRSLSRRAKLARARAAAMARELAQTLLPRFKTSESGDLVPDLRAAAAIIYDPETNQVLWEENSQTQRSIASITKVMTATVFLETNPELTRQVTIATSDVYRASTTYLRLNDRVTVDDLLHLLLIPSDNAAARALARVSPYGAEGFVQRMNERAAELGLENTSYADTSGLLSANVSSAYDMARLITFASSDERIGSIMRTPQHTVHVANRRPRSITFRNTNHLLSQPDVDVRAGKTGFIAKAGYCLATLLRLPQGGQQVAVVVLGARSNAGRFLETKNLFAWMSTKASTLFGAADAQTPQAAAQIP